MGVLGNYHTHSRWCDGQGETADVIEAAIAADLSQVGITSHAPVPFPATYALPLANLRAYREEVLRLREVYRDRIDDVDTMVGLFAETPPPGFGFSDTAFRVFLLMASRRLQSDRFLTVDFRPEVYSPLGMDWVATNTMGSVVLRHCPELAAVLPREGNAFTPWRPVQPR